MEPLSAIHDPSSFHPDLCHDNDYDLNYDQLVGLLHTESQYFAINHPNLSQKCCPEWRRTMGQWCFRVVDHFALDRELVSIAMQYLDRFSLVLVDGDRDKCGGSNSSNNNKKKKILLEDGPTYQLVAMTCLYLALKLFLDTDHNNDDYDDDEMDPDYYNRQSKQGPQQQQQQQQQQPPRKLDKPFLLYETLTDLSRGRFRLTDVTGMEHIILDRLQWKITPVTALTFVQYYLSVWWWNPTESHHCRKDDGTHSISSSPGSMNRVVLHIVTELARYLTEIAVFLMQGEEEDNNNNDKNGEDNDDSHDEKKECDEPGACYLKNGKKDMPPVTPQRMHKETTTARNGATPTANKAVTTTPPAPAMVATKTNGQLPSQIALAAILVSMDLITYEALPPTAREHFCNGVVQTAWPFWQQQMSTTTTTMSASSSTFVSIQYWQERMQEILLPELWLEEENYCNSMTPSSLSSNQSPNYLSSSPISMAREYGILNVPFLPRAPSTPPPPPSLPSSPTSTFQSQHPSSASSLGKNPSSHQISSHDSSLAAMNWGRSPVSVMHQSHHQFHPEHHQYDQLYHHYPDQQLPHYIHQGGCPHGHGHHHHFDDCRR